MPVVKRTCYTARCDRCGNDRENADMWTPHFDSFGEALGEAEGDDWVQLADGRVLDPVCIAALVQSGEIEAYDGDDLAAPAYRIIPALPVIGEVFHGKTGHEKRSYEEVQAAYEATLPLSRRERRPAAPTQED